MIIVIVAITGKIDNVNTNYAFNGLFTIMIVLPLFTDTFFESYLRIVIFILARSTMYFNDVCVC